MSRPIRLLSFALAYILLALLSYSVAYTPEGALAVWWAPSGLALAVLVRAERRSLPWYLLAIAVTATLVNVAQPISVPQIAWRSLADVLEPFVGAALLRRLFGRNMELGTVREVLAFAVIGGIVGPTAGALVAGLGLSLSDVRLGEAGMFALVWWGSAVLGAMLFAPILLTWNRSLEMAGRSRRLEAALLVAGLLLVSIGAFFIPGQSSLTVLIGFAAFPLLAWAAGRFGPQGAARSAVALSLFSLWPLLTDQAQPDVWQIIVSQGIYAIGVLTALALSALTAEMQHERARAEAQARRSEESRQIAERALREAREAVRVREDFLSIASHELKTPLTPLAARLRFIQRRLAAGESIDPASIEKPLQSLRKLTELINDLLDAARIEHGRLMINLVPQPVSDLVRRSAEPFRGASSRHSIELDLPDEALWVQADPQRLTQVLSNLVDNAIKYSPAGGTVKLAVRPHSDGVELIVSDRGIGIPEEQRCRLFERFYRAENSSVSYGGLGLGLYITRDIVDRHGGRIWAENRPGGGASFHVVLPRIASAEVFDSLH